MAEVAPVTEDVSFSGKAGEIRAFVAQPTSGGSRPAVIVVQEWWGLNEHIRDVARRLARQGYFAIAPDLYSRQGHRVATDPDTAAQLMAGLNKPDGIEDLKSTIAYLRRRSETGSPRIGLIGFCMGGSYALLLPCSTTGISAAAPFYGEVPADETIARLTCPIFYAYGENDGWTQRKDVDRLSAQLRKLNKPGEVKVYNGCSHGFFNDTRPDVYRAAESRDAWEHALALFAAELRR